METQNPPPSSAGVANVAFPPPLMLLILILAGLLLGWLIPWRLAAPGSGHARVHLWIGILIIVADLAFIGIPAFRAMLRMKTHPSPYKPVTALVEASSFRFTRNPLYLSMLIIITGVFFIANSFWLLVMAVLFFFLVQELVIKREEKYLEGKFGEPYRSYRKRVRRWL